MTEDYAELLDNLETLASGGRLSTICAQATLAIRELLWERDRLRKSMEFYANPEIYKPHPHGPAFDRRDLSYHAIVALGEI
jgi:hypothetical protein